MTSVDKNKIKIKLDEVLTNLGNLIAETATFLPDASQPPHINDVILRGQLQSAKDSLLETKKLLDEGSSENG